MSINVSLPRPRKQCPSPTPRPDLSLLYSRIFTVRREWIPRSRTPKSVPSYPLLSLRSSTVLLIPGTVKDLRLRVQPTGRVGILSLPLCLVQALPVPVPYGYPRRRRNRVGTGTFGVGVEETQYTSSRSM